MEKQLFPGRENEILTAIHALQNPVLEFHELPLVAVLPDTVGNHLSTPRLPGALMRRALAFCSPLRCRLRCIVTASYKCAMSPDNSC